jgi:ketosteroid isomerase-like protein
MPKGVIMIAISYRREDSTSIAGRLHDRLRAEFGRENVFMDFDSIPYGVDFREHIAETLEKADIVIAVIGPRWLGDRGESARRIDDATDFVRLEVVGALQRGIPVIPILVDNTPMPRVDTLPSDLKPLVFRNALVLDAGIDFHNHVDRLIAGIRRQLKDIRSPARRGLKQKTRDRTSGQEILGSGHKVTASGRFKWLGVLNKLMSSAPSPQQNQGPDVRPLSQPSVAEPITAVPKKMPAQEKASKQKPASRSKKQSMQPQGSSQEPSPPAAVPAAAPVPEQAIAPPPPPVGTTAVSDEKRVITTPPAPMAGPAASVQQGALVLPAPSVAAASLSAGAKKPQNLLFSGRLLGLVLVGGLLAFATYFVVISRSKSTTDIQPAVPSPLITPDTALSASPATQPTVQALAAETPLVVSSAAPAVDANDHQATTGDTMPATASISPPSTATPTVIEPSESSNQQSNSVTSVDDETVRQFVRDYYTALSRRDLDAVVNKFSDAVDYQGQGHHDRKYIRTDMKNYFRRWDKIVFDVGDISVSRNGDGSFVVSFNFPFAVAKGLSPEKQGVSSQVWMLREEPPGNLQIVSQREKVVAGRPDQRKSRR